MNKKRKYFVLVASHFDLKNKQTYYVESLAWSFDKYNTTPIQYATISQQFQSTYFFKNYSQSERAIRLLRKVFPKCRLKLHITEEEIEGHDVNFFLKRQQYYDFKYAMKYILQKRKCMKYKQKFNDK